MNRIAREQQQEIVELTLQGFSMNSVIRQTGFAKNTVMRHIHDIGLRCKRALDLSDEKTLALPEIEGRKECFAMKTEDGELAVRALGEASRRWGSKCILDRLEEWEVQWENRIFTEAFNHLKWRVAA